MKRVCLSGSMMPLFFLLLSFPGFGQNVITTTVPFLLISPDAFGSGLGDAGAAVSPDASSIYWNPAKLAFEKNKAGIMISYTPWMPAISNDLSLSFGSLFFKPDKLSAIGASYRYFNAGDLSLTDNNGNIITTIHAYETAFDLVYSRKLTKHLSIGICGKYIYSDLCGNNIILSSHDTSRAGKDIAGDISLFYQTKSHAFGLAANWSFGANISNMGGKISYVSNGHSDFLPANLRLGAALELSPVDSDHVIFTLNFNKLLVPSPPVYYLNSVGTDSLDPAGNPIIKKGMNPDVPVVQGMIQSFYDAPGGFVEEMSEINPSIGIEYILRKNYYGTVGYFYESPDKGNRQYLTLGIGAEFHNIYGGLSYLFPTSKGNYPNPLTNTIRLSLGYNFK